MLNPFAWHGGTFLFFYLVVGIAALIGQFLWSRARELSGLVPQLNMTDPYQIAYLRGGSAQALNIAAVSLIDRGLLKGADALLTAEPNAVGMVRRPIEKAVLQLYRSAGNSAEMAKSQACLATCDEYQRTLEDFELIAGPRAFAQRLVPLLVVAVSLGFIGFLKIVMAVAEGRDYGLIVAMMGFFGFVALKIYRRHRTARGDAMIADLQVLFSRLRDRADSLRQGGATNEAALLAAVYGVDKLPPERFPGTKPLRRKKQDSSCGGGSGCGSSCSGSCGGGCGGGCGG
jgi:uncharacterized protein (TIGR04222 family)